VKTILRKGLVKTIKGAQTCKQSRAMATLVVFGVFCKNVQSLAIKIYFS
jgi:hypothetical protein